MSSARLINIIRHLWVLPLFLAGSLLAGCAGLDSGPEPKLPRVSSLNGTDAGYQLKPGDQVKIVVFGEDRFSGDFTVSPDGAITIPQLGAVPAARSTVRGLESQLKQRLISAGVSNPHVSILYDSAKTVKILGAVQAPGTYPFQPGMTVSAAVALAGGYSWRARTGKVVLKPKGQQTGTTRRVSEVAFLNPGDELVILEK